MTPDNMLAFFSTALKYANWVNHGLPELMSNDGAQILYSGTGGSGKTTLIKALTSFMTTTEWSLSQTTAFESQEAQQSNVLTCNEVGLYELSHNSFKIAADTKVLR